MTNKEALSPCCVPGCKDNRITEGFESGPNMHFVQCASTEHVLKVYGFTAEQARERWNRPLRPSSAEVDVEKCACGGSSYDSFWRTDWCFTCGHLFTRKQAALQSGAGVDVVSIPSELDERMHTTIAAAIFENSLEELFLTVDEELTSALYSAIVNQALTKNPRGGGR